jgi:site-specific recombinase XerD
MKGHNSSRTNFKNYLQGKEYSHASIATYERFTDQFLEWLQKENMEVGQVRYQDILLYMKHCSSKKNHSQRTVQHTIITLGHYFDYLQDAQQIEGNPTKGIKVQGVKRKTLYHILEPHELHAIYNSYGAETLSQKKNKVIVGMLVYQGLKTEELDKLETKDVKLKEGKVEIAGSRKSNARTLQLEAHQVLDVYEYVMQVRPQILEKTKQPAYAKASAGRQTEKPACRTGRLFVSVEGGEKLRIDFLMSQLRKQNPKLENADQLRASVIVKWLKQHNLREVQYLAGHRYISSTEAYKQNEMEGLSEEVNMFHPLG